MADAETIRQVAQARTPFSAWIGVVLLFALFGVIVLAIIGPSPRGDTYEQKRAKAREEKLKVLQEEDGKALSTYAWVDKTKGAARIPIERAMELTVTELAQKKPAPAGPIVTAEQPTVAETGAAAPSPAPVASPTPTGTPKPTSVAGPSSEARGQPAAAVNPPPASPGTQPGAAASPAATPPHAAAQPAKSPEQPPVQSPPGTPLPVRGKETPTPTPR